MFTYDLSDGAMYKWHYINNFGSKALGDVIKYIILYMPNMKTIRLDDSDIQKEFWNMHFWIQVLNPWPIYATGRN